MTLKLCRCEQCRAGRRKWKPMIRARMRGAKARDRAALKLGMVDKLLGMVRISYTD